MNTSPQAECASDSSQPGAQTQGACVLIPELPSTGGEAGESLHRWHRGEAAAPGGEAGNPMPFPGACSQSKAKSL